LRLKTYNQRVQEAHNNFTFGSQYAFSFIQGGYVGHTRSYLLLNPCHYTISALQCSKEVKQSIPIENSKTMPRQLKAKFQDRKHAVILLGSLASVRLVNAIDEEEDGGVALDIVLMRQLVLDGCVDLGQNNAIGLELGGGRGVLGREGLAVATPGGVELDQDEAVVLHDCGEVALLQNDDVLVVDFGLLECLLGGGVKAGEVAKVVFVVVIVVEVVGIWEVGAVRRGGDVIGFLEEAEIFIVVAVVFLVFVVV